MTSTAILRRKPRILFVGATNANRTVMAHAYMRSIGGEVFDARSAGMELGRVEPETIALMSEEGVDIKDLRPVALNQEMLEWADLVIVIAGLGETVDPKVPDSARMKFWPVERPDTGGDAEAQLAAQRSVRDQVKRRVTQLVTSVRLFKG
jgi:protein-tyrosine-phosphatase